MHPWVLLNDSIRSADEAMLKPGQLGLLAGWGVFTTLRIYRGVPFAFERHWERMKRDAELIHVPFEFDRHEVRKNLLEMIERNDAAESSVRLCVVRSENGVMAGPGLGNPSDLIAFSIDLRGWSETIALGVREQGRHAASPFAGTKTLSWAHNLTMVETANQEGYGEVVLLNERGEVAECTSANIFTVVKGVTYTPPLRSGPLPGVTRAVMLEEIDEPVEEKILTLDDLYEADEVFITSSTRELIPVDRILDRRLKGVERGVWPVMEQLRRSLRSYVDKYVEANRG